MNRSAVFLLLVGSLSALSATAEAQDDAARREARALFREANRLFARRDFEGALDLYFRSNDRFPSPRVLVNAATTLRELGRIPEAAETYERALASPGDDLPRGARAEIEQTLAGLDASLGRLLIRAPEGARVSVDGRAIGTAPLGWSVRASPGTHEVVARKEGVSPASSRVEVAAGAVEEVLLALHEGAPSSPTPGGDGPDLSPRAEVAGGAPSAATQSDAETDEGGSIFSKWWFWGGVGVVAAGAVAAILLVPGKSGSDTPPELGTIQ